MKMERVLLNSLTLFVKQLNRQLEEVYGKIILRSSITWIAFPFSGSLAEFRVVYYPTDTHIFAIFYEMSSRAAFFIIWQTAYGFLRSCIVLLPFTSSQNLIFYYIAVLLWSIIDNDILSLLIAYKGVSPRPPAIFVCSSLPTSLSSPS
jgi:hypothetical protein